jgi:hypothetical protein
MALALMLGTFQFLAQPTKAVLTLAVRNVADDQNMVYMQSITDGGTATSAHRFLVKVNDDSATANATSGASNDTLTIKVKNNTRGVTGTFTVLESAVEAKWNMYVQGEEQAAAVNTTTGLTAAASKIIPAFEGDEITVSYTPFAKSLTVDNIGPVLSGSTPAYKAVTKVGSITFSADVTDTGSGFSTSSSSIDDFDTEFGTLSITLLGAVINKKDLTYTSIDNGWNISLTTSLGTSGVSTSVPWKMTAVDRAGNSTDLDRTSSSYQLTVDGKKPVIKATNTRSSVALQARSGAKWDGSKLGVADPDGAAPALTSNRARFGSKGGSKNILVLFDEAGGLDVDSIDPSDFTVDGLVPTSAIVVDILEDSEVTPSSSSRRPQEVYLTMGDSIASNKKPKIALVGTVKDVAGNTADADTVTAVDGMPPKFTITVSKDYDEKDSTITITVDETLVSAPVLTLTAQASKTTVGGSASTPTLTATGAQSYEKKIKIGDAPGANTARKIVVQVSGSDASPLANAGTGGSSDPSSTSAVSFQLDNELNNSRDPKFTVAGTAIFRNGNLGDGSGDDTEIEGVDPLLITVGFNYDCDDDDCASGGEKTEYSGDTHKTVTLSKYEVEVVASDGSKTKPDVSLSTTDNITFTISVSNPPIGDYTVTLNAEDEAGNVSTTAGASVATEIEAEFEVIAAKPVKLALNPGWNLISLPFQPSNPSLNSVIAADHPISLVMAFDNTNSTWAVSRRDADSGLFTGDVTTMAAATGYFVFTNSLEPLSVLRPGLATAAAAPAQPPAITVNQGWNLVPVLSNTVPLPEGLDADTYFGTLVNKSGTTAWLMALSWQTATQTWLSVSPNVAAAASHNRCPSEASGNLKPQVCIGEGLWLWSTMDQGVIIPR